MKRMWWIGFIAIAMILTNNGFLGSAQAADKEVVSQTWGGAHGEAQIKGFHEPFFEATGIKVIPVVASSDIWGKVAAQVKSGNVEWDVINPSDYPGVAAAAKNGLLEEIDYKIVTDTKDLVPGSVMKYGVGMTISDMVFCYNNKVFTGINVPKTWADFYNPTKFPGPRSMHNWGVNWVHFVTALLADGVPPDKIAPFDYDRAFKVMDRIKPFVKIWYPSGDKGMQVLIDQEAVLASFTDARVKIAQGLGAPITLVWNQNIPVLTYSCVVKGAPHKEAAMRYINMTCNPKYQAKYNSYSRSCGTNPKFLDSLDPDKGKLEVAYADNWKLRADVMNDKFSAWLSEHMAEVNEKFTSWLTK